MRSRILAVVALLALSLAACDVLIGLDKFQKCDACGGDASGDANSIDASDSGLDAVALPDGVSEASSWARWQMTNTAAEVLTGAPDASAPNFVPIAAIEIEDGVTHLVWSTTVGTVANVTDAAAFCANTGTGYRLPTRIEIASLLDSTQQAAPFIAQPFVKLVGNAAALWSASYVRPINGTIQFWFADLSTGDMGKSTATNTGVLCVR